MEDLAERFARYLESKLGGASEISVGELQRIHGGASRETYRLVARYRKNDRTVRKAMILRRDPESSLIETERATEFDAYRAFHGTSVPVPEPLYLETDRSWLDRPFFVMEAVEGCESSPRLLNEPPFADLRERIGEQKWRILGEIARADPETLGLTAAFEVPVPKSCWKRELGYWEAVIDEDELMPQPIARAAIRWLRRNPPPPPRRIGVVHGDYRTGNFLFDRQGKVRAILDWEMCHLGDPLEDLAWALNPLWGWPDANRPGKLIERDRAIRIWEESSGLKIEPRALEWWEVFSSVKGLAIWISSSREFADAKNQDAVLTFAGWFCTDVHNRVLVDKLAPIRRYSASGNA